MTEKWDNLIEDLPEKWGRFAIDVKEHLLHRDGEVSPWLDVEGAEMLTIGILNMNLAAEREEIRHAEESIERFNES